MTEKQIKKQIDKLNTKLSKIIDKFVDSVEKTSKDFKELFPSMNDNDFRDKADLFRKNLQKCILTPKEDYDNIVTEIINMQNTIKEEHADNTEVLKNTETSENPKKNKIDVVYIK